MFLICSPGVLLAAAALVYGALAIDGTKYLFIFGDSYTSTGFEINGTKPSPSNPMGNPALPGDTLAGGLTWAGHLTLDLNTSLTLTYDFAVSGATVDNAIIEGFAPGIPSITDQLATWKANLEEKPDYAPWTPDNALFFVWVGINDVGNSFSEPGILETLGRDIDRLFEHVHTLWDSGARNFVFLNVPREGKPAATEKTPFMLAQDTTNLITSISFWNDELTQRLDAFQQEKYQAVNITLVDMVAPFELALANPAEFGATDATCQACPGQSPLVTCADPDPACLWYNSYHPGQPLQKLIAGTVAEALSPVWF